MFAVNCDWFQRQNNVNRMCKLKSHATTIKIAFLCKAISPQIPANKMRMTLEAARGLMLSTRLSMDS